jgi:hypothetical protein
MDTPVQLRCISDQTVDRLVVHRWTEEFATQPKSAHDIISQLQVVAAEIPFGRFCNRHPSL